MNRYTPYVLAFAVFVLLLGLAFSGFGIGSAFASSTRYQYSDFDYSVATWVDHTTYAELSDGCADLDFTGAYLEFYAFGDSGYQIDFLLDGSDAGNFVQTVSHGPVLQSSLSFDYGDHTFSVCADNSGDAVDVSYVDIYDASPTGPTSTATRTSLATRTVTLTPTASKTKTPSPTRTVTLTPTASATKTPSPTRTITLTPTASKTKTLTPTRTVTRTLTITSTKTPSPTRTDTLTPTASATKTPSPTRTVTLTPTASKTKTPSATPR